MKRTLTKINFNCFVEKKGSPINLLSDWIALASEVERLFNFRFSYETLSWEVHVFSFHNWGARVSLIDRSDVNTRLAKKHDVMIAHAVCPEIIALNKGLCGFPYEEHLPPKKLALQIVERLNKTRG